MTKILVVDDDQGMREFLEIMLSREGYSVVAVENAPKALNLCATERFNLVITDLKMPKLDGIEFLKKIKDIDPGMTVILITAFASAETALSAMKEGAYDYIEKDFDIEDLIKIIRKALENKGVKRDDEPVKAKKDIIKFGQMISKSKEMIKIFNTIKKVAETTTNVLILGESGTGKELVAKAIHEHSPRKNMPFVVINCGGVPENLLESEFFGYMKGAFTGAYSDKPGLFEIARGGTLFLDEIGDLSSFLQVKLLRVVQEKTFRRLGGSENIHADVRIISATNWELAKKVKEGMFREDLYYRLNVIPIQLPPLRKRPEDIPILTTYFIEKYSKEFSKEVKTISAYALALLMDYPFPGNIRELENIIERSVALESSSIILPENLVLAGDLQKTLMDGEAPIPDKGINLNDEIAKYEKNLIEKALKKTNGSRSKAADLLKITVDSLKYRMEKLSIE
ncbi:MAG: Regulatory protein AtoC [Syntrophus sp. SKADARSKE-3]|nr:Regulatory protein AtoC [Syntrophus sp. SKADARSKE-3]